MEVRLIEFRSGSNIHKDLRAAGTLSNWYQRTLRGRHKDLDFILYSRALFKILK